jgi:hypothetical protein
VIITEPGIYPDMPEEVYHRDPVPEGSLSSTGARRMLPPYTPAQFEYERRHPVFKEVFDYGSAAHKLVLGIGPKIEVIEHDSWRTNDAKDRRDAARAAGFIPLLRHDHEHVKAMAAAIQDHELAGQLLDPLSGGKAEQSLFWIDEEFGVWCRVRLDWLSTYRVTSTGQLIVPDYKTADSADPETFARKSAAAYGYHQQDAFYCEAVRQVLGEDPAFWFIVQEKTPPYLVSIVELSPEDRHAGHARNRVALERFRDCQASGIWPGYPPDRVMVAMPPWARAKGEDLYL